MTRFKATPLPLSRVRMPGRRALPRGRHLYRRMSRQGRLAMLTLLIVLGGIGGCWVTRRPSPTSLSRAVLTGTRGPGCLRLAVLGDVSGSMANYTAPRDAAVRQILAWAPTQLRGDDELAVIDWGGNAAVALPTTPVAGFALTQLVSPSVDSTSSNLQPAVDELRDEPAGICRTLIVVVSDGLIANLPADSLREELTAAGVSRVVLLRPSKSLGLPAIWRQVLPYSTSTAVDGTDPNAVALTLGRLIATETGQHLEHR